MIIKFEGLIMKYVIKNIEAKTVTELQRALKERFV